jgi:hypothetical protein
MAQNTMTLEEQAAYRPQIATNLLNILTGGLYGGVTGQNVRQTEAQRAREMLQAEELQKSREQRALDRDLERRMFEIGATTGAEIPREGNLYDRMNAFYRNLARSAVEAEAGARAGYGFAEVPTAEQQGSMAYNQAAAKAQMERYQKMSDAKLKEEINRPQAIAEANALKIQFDPNEPTAAIEARIADAKQIRGQEYAYKEKADINRAEIAQAKADNEFPFLASFDVDKATAGQLNAMADKLDRERKRSALTADQKRVESITQYEQRIEDARAAGDLEKVQELVYRSPYIKEIRNNPYWQDKAQTKVEIPKKKEEELAELPTQMNDAVSFVRNVGKLAKGRNINEVSKMSFNTLTSTLDNYGAAYFGNDEARNALQAIKQEFEGIVSKGRKTLFGASLTDRELASAQTLFGDYARADFLPRAIQFIDKVFAMKPSERYPGYLGMGRHDRAVEPLMNEYSTIRSTLNWVPFESMVSRNQPVQITSPAPQPTKPAGSSRGGLTPEQRAAAERRINELLQKQ